MAVTYFHCRRHRAPVWPWGIRKTLRAGVMCVSVHIVRVSAGSGLSTHIRNGIPGPAVEVLDSVDIPAEFGREAGGAT